MRVLYGGTPTVDEFAQDKFLILWFCVEHGLV